LTPERWAQIRQIFDGALERPQQDRAAYLRVRCARDEELRREVESLLSNYEGSEEFLNTPAVDLSRALATFEEHSSELPVIPRVGPYQLERRIGRGGMGTVWLATRFDHEYEKKVAVKMVKQGMDSHEILRRFRMERQVLAGLDHSNIARLIDGGSTPDGLPYLVMEYVEGTPIDQYCESRQSTISERLKLFRDVCAAVQYAHQNLVVHRDIKTGNILVTTDGVPKLLDFGIAKLIRSEFSTLSAAETRPELRPMTLDYASPEQVRGEPITTATDVYSLGVLLYKLLTGKFPYGSDLKSRVALQQAICEREPLRPSTVVLTDAKSAIPQATQKIEVALQQQQQETRDKARRRLKHKLAGDLDMIILKALRKEPQRRYISVEQFSEDVRRYLEGRPVIARSDTFGYRTAKFLRRNAGGVAAGAIIVLLLVGATVLSVINARSGRRLLEDAQRRELTLAPALVRSARLLGDQYYSTDPAAAATQYRQAISAAREFIQSHPEQLGGSNDVRGDLALARLRLGDLSPPDAIALYTDALAQFEAAAQAAPGDSDRQRDLIMAARRLGLAQFSAGNPVAAEMSLNRALQVAESMQPSSAESRRAVAECNFEFGEVLAGNKVPEAAAAKLRKALDTYRELAGSTVKAAPVDQSPASFEEALRQVAASAPPDLRKEIESELARFGR
jgi:serine/threonine protein kinase